MITSAIISVFASALYLVFQFIPQVTSAPDWWTLYIHPTMAVFSGLGVLPVVGTIMQITLLVLSFLAGWQAIVFANWLYNKIRGSG